MNRENVVNSKKEFTGIPRKSKKFHKNTKKLRKIACALGTPPSRGPDGASVVLMAPCAKPAGRDHTSTSAPDPIRTPKLSVLGREQY